MPLRSLKWGLTVILKSMIWISNKVLADVHSFSSRTPLIRRIFSDLIHFSIMRFCCSTEVTHYSKKARVGINYRPNPNFFLLILQLKNKLQSKVKASFTILSQPQFFGSELTYMVDLYLNKYGTHLRDTTCNSSLCGSNDSMYWLFTW